MYFCSKFASPIGHLTLVSSLDKLVGLWIEQQKYFMTCLKKECIVEDEVEILSFVKRWLDAYFSGRVKSADKIPVMMYGSDFQKLVWSELKKIPYGKTDTYGHIAQVLSYKLGIPKMSAQAVGNAIGKNPISIIVPCHRVIGKNGNLTGYAAGIDKKRYLLKLEKG